MLKRDAVVGHRIKQLVADTSLSDDALNFADFICVLDTGVAFRLPYDHESDDWFTEVTPSENHYPVAFPRARWWHYYRCLWRSPIRDVLIPADPELRFPDSSRILLNSGWYLAQCSGTPIGIMPSIDIMPDVNTDNTMVSIWSVRGDVVTGDHDADEQNAGPERR